MMRITTGTLLALILLLPCDVLAGDLLAAHSASNDSLLAADPQYNDNLMAIDLVLLTVGVWAPSRILGTEWAYIGFNTVKDNMKTGFVWDHDDWAMNQWGHPLHGGQFYNAARTNGHDFWGSIPYTLTGSMAWELFMEAEPPSINDLLTTTAGGVYMGETSYRISSLLLDNTASGSERTFREVGAFFINPIRGFNRLVTGKTSGYSPNPKEWTPGYLGGRITAGTNHVADGTDLKNSMPAFLLKLSFLYGDPFEDQADPKPFDYFSLRTALTLHGHFPLIHEVSGTGMVHGRKFEHGEDNRSIYGMYYDYDYFDSRVYQFGGQSIGPGLFTRFNQGAPMQVLTGVQLNAVILGGSNVGFETADGREYNYTTGSKFKLFAMLDHKKYGTFGIRYWVYWFHTLSGISGDEFIHYGQASLNPRLFGKWGVGLEYTYYLRNSYFDNYPESHLKNIELRTFISLKF